VDRIIGDCSGNCNPLYAYVDVAQVWLKEPLNARQVAWLSGQCGSPLLGGHFKKSKPPWWDRSYQQGFRLCQPSKQAIEFLAQRNDVLVTYAELALDVIMPDEQSCSLLRDLFDNHFVQRWHGNRETERFTGVGGRTGKRSKRAINISWYTDRPSKITGEIPCFQPEFDP
jgi:hypothetical protein